MYRSFKESLACREETKRTKEKKNLNRLAHAQSRIFISAFVFEEDIYVYWIYEWETDLYTGSITNLNRDHFLVLNAIIYDYTCMLHTDRMKETLTYTGFCEK